MIKMASGYIQYFINFLGTPDAYMIFVIFAPQTRFLGYFLLSMDVASKQRKSQQDSIHCKFVMWSNFVMTKLLHMTCHLLV